MAGSQQSDEHKARSLKGSSWEDGPSHVRDLSGPRLHSASALLVGAARPERTLQFGFSIDLAGPGVGGLLQHRPRENENGS